MVGGGGALNSLLTLTDHVHTGHSTRAQVWHITCLHPNGLWWDWILYHSGLPHNIHVGKPIGCFVSAAELSTGYFFFVGRAFIFTSRKGVIVGGLNGNRINMSTIPILAAFFLVYAIALMWLRQSPVFTSQALNLVLRATVYPLLSHLPTKEANFQQLHQLEALHGNWALWWRQCGGRSPYVRPLNCGSLSGQWVLLRQPCRYKGSILYIHGGAFVLGTASQYWALTSRLAALLPEYRVLALDYRKAPLYPFPAALDDCVSAYRYLVEGVGPGRVILIGDSAGGNLAFATTIYCLQHNLPVPAGVVGLAPWLDPGLPINVAVTRAERTCDPMLPAYRKDEAVDLYIKGVGYSAAIRNAELPQFGKVHATHPLVSPLRSANTELARFPPVCIHVGSRDFLLQEAVSFIQRLRVCNPQAKAELRIWHGLPHVFQLFPSLLPEAVASLREIADFVRNSTCV
jgi:epsilon-lactone hydrolase